MIFLIFWENICVFFLTFQWKIFHFLHFSIENTCFSWFFNGKSMIFLFFHVRGLFLSKSYVSNGSANVLWDKTKKPCVATCRGKNSIGPASGQHRASIGPASGQRRASIGPASERVRTLRLVRSCEHVFAERVRTRLFSENVK